MLKDIIPTRYRKKVYAIVTLAATIFGIWQASNGDWSTFVASVLTALTTGLATANTDGPLLKRGEDGVVNLSPIVTVLFAIFLVVAILWLIGHPLHIG